MPDHEPLRHAGDDISLGVCIKIAILNTKFCMFNAKFIDFNANSYHRNALYLQSEREIYQSPACI